MNTYDIIFKRLVALGIHTDADAVPEYRRSVSGGFMDLVVERLPHLDYCATERSGCVYSLAHYFEQNGDLCADPEMTLIVYPASQLAEALSFQQTMPPVYQVVYPTPGKVSVKEQRALNHFLNMWLNNLIKQGHGVAWA